MDSLAAQSVTHRFGNTVALDDVTFTVRDSEFVALIGPSGCGKTTILNLFAGFILPSSGVCSDRRGPITGPSSARTVVFQEYALFPWLTARQNIALGLSAKGYGSAETHRGVDRWLALVHLERAADRFPGQLSGGMQQRIAIARALALEPEVVLLDEPFGALDLLTREALQEEVLRVRTNSPGSFVLVTHSVDEAIFMSDRIIVMSPPPGRILEILDVPLPYPRTPDLRVDNHVFLSLRAHITTLLRQHSGNGGA